MKHDSNSTWGPCPLLGPISWVDHFDIQLLLGLEHLILHHCLRGYRVGLLRALGDFGRGLTWLSLLRMWDRVQIIGWHFVFGSRPGHILILRAFLLNSVHPLARVFDTLRALGVLVRTFHASFRIGVYHQIVVVDVKLGLLLQVLMGPFDYVLNIQGPFAIVLRRLVGGIYIRSVFAHV